MPKASQKTTQRRGRKAEASSQATQSSRRQHEDDDVGSQSTQSQAKHVLSGEELNRKVSDLVRYMLFMDAKKTPVKRGDITKIVMKEYSRSFITVFNEAKKKLKKTFGYDLVETEHNKQKVYILVNDISTEQRKIVGSNPDELPKMGLLLVILGIVFMKDNVLSEELLWQTLKRLGIIKGKHHCTFGDVEKLVTVEFVRQMYLDRKKVVTGDTATYNFSWGTRADHEIAKRDVLKMVSEVYDTKIEAWSAKYKEVMSAEENDSGDSSD